LIAPCAPTIGIADPLNATTPAASEAVSTIRTASFAEVLRGVTFTLSSR